MPTLESDGERVREIPEHCKSLPMPTGKTEIGKWKQRTDNTIGKHRNNNCAVGVALAPDKVHVLAESNAASSLSPKLSPIAAAPPSVVRERVESKPTVLATRIDMHIAFPMWTTKHAESQNYISCVDDKACKASELYVLCG